MKVFRYPNTTYLTSFTFNTLGKCMEVLNQKMEGASPLAVLDLY